MTDAVERLYEQALVLRCQAGDEHAFAELVARYGPRLRYYLRKLISDRDRADDVLQDVWFDVFRALPRLADPRAFAGWAYRIARDRAFREFRTRHPLLPLEGDLPPATNLEDDFSPDDAAAVHAALDALAPEHREVLVLRFLEEMTYEEIGRVKGLPAGHRAVPDSLREARPAGRTYKGDATVNEKEMGEALLRVDAAGLAGVPEAQRHTWAVLERDRQRVRLLTWATVFVWLTAGALVMCGLVNFALTFPRQAKIVQDIEAGTLKPADRDEAQRLVLVSFQMGTLLIAFSVAVMTVAALCTVFLILASRRATVRQLNAGLAEIAEQLRQLRPAGGGVAN